MLPTRCSKPEAKRRQPVAKNVWNRIARSDGALMIIGHPSVRIRSYDGGKAADCGELIHPAQIAPKMSLPGASHGAPTRQIGTAKSLKFPKDFVQSRAEDGLDCIDGLDGGGAIGFALGVAQRRALDEMPATTINGNQNEGGPEPKHQTRHQPRRPQNQPRWLSAPDKMVGALDSLPSWSFRSVQGHSRRMKHEIDLQRFVVYGTAERG